MPPGRLEGGYAYLSEDPCDNPNADHDKDPGTPPDNGVAVCVPRFAHHAEIDKFRADVGIDDADDESRDNDEGE